MSSASRTQVCSLVALVAIAGCGVLDTAKAAKELGKACEGSAVPGAAAYVAGPGEHPMIALRSGKRSYELAARVLTMDTPAGRKLDQTQLVLCIDEPQERELEVCNYDTVTKVGFIAVPGTRTEGPSFPRTLQVQRVRIVAANTAVTVAETELSGPKPPACDATLIGGPSAEYFHGRDVGDLTIGEWAEPFASGTVAAAP